MRSIETEGDSIDLAIENALQTLQVGRDQVEVEILADATKGLFGFGGKKARVRATVRPPLTARLQSTEIGSASNDSRATIAPRTSSPRTDSQGTGASTSPPTRAGRDAEAVAAATVSDAFVGRCKAVLEELIDHLGISCSVTARPGEDGSVLLDPGVLLAPLQGHHVNVQLAQLRQRPCQHVCHRLHAAARPAKLPRIPAEKRDFKLSVMH